MFNTEPYWTIPRELVKKLIQKKKYIYMDLVASV